MRGVGGPLLCIGDLLSDVGESDAGGDQLPSHPINTPPPDFNSSLQPSDLNKLFQVLFHTTHTLYLYSFFLSLY